MRILGLCGAVWLAACASAPRQPPSKWGRCAAQAAAAARAYQGIAPRTETHSTSGVHGVVYERVANGTRYRADYTFVERRGTCVANLQTSQSPA